MIRVPEQVVTQWYRIKNPEQSQIDMDIYHLKLLGKEKQVFTIWEGEL